MIFKTIDRVYSTSENIEELERIGINKNIITIFEYTINKKFSDYKYFKDIAVVEVIKDAFNNNYNCIMIVKDNIKFDDLSKIDTVNNYDLNICNKGDICEDLLIIKKPVIDYINNFIITSDKKSYFEDDIKIDNIKNYYNITDWKNKLWIGVFTKFTCNYINIAHHKIDYVISYVNSNDKTWQDLYEKYKPIKNESFNGEQRWKDWGLLEYNIGLLKENLKWINNIYLLVSSKSQIPYWISRYKNIIPVLHEEFIEDRCLPTFNSCTIENFLPFIPGLSEYFLYANDDFYIIKELSNKRFFENGKIKLDLINVGNRSTNHQKISYNTFKILLSEFNIQYFNEINLEKKYKRLTHYPQPMIKSSGLHVCKIHYNPIIHSITRFRNDKNINQYLFPLYEYLTNNWTNSNIKHECVSMEELEKINSIISNKIFETLCINDNSTNYKNSNEIKNTIKSVFNENFNISVNRVALCAIAKNENLYIREWVEHYKNLGFDNIHLYDNNDVNGEHFEDVISDYIKSGFVIIHNVRGVWPAQVESYNKFYQTISNQYSWILFCDIDEFLEIENKHISNIKNILSKNIYDNFDIIKLCWKYYDDSGFVRIENENYSVKRFTNHNKNIVSNSQTKMFIKGGLPNIIINSPHGALKIYGQNLNVNCCNTIGNYLEYNNIFYSKHREIFHSVMWLNHYRFKTITEYVNKSLRGWPTTYKNGGKQYMNAKFFFRFNKYTAEKHVVFAKLNNRIYTRITSFGSLINKNWGDDINFSFISELTNFKYEFGHANLQYKVDNYALIGSIIDNIYINECTIIWGSGIPHENVILTTIPKKILAVRGPLTRNKLIEQNIYCPEVYGDPALLIHKIYKPNNIVKKYKLGIIPHISNINHQKLNNFKLINNVIIIDLQNYDNWKDIVDKILSCEYIASESLHGLIVAQQYNIPNLWINIEDNKNKNLGVFKYHDFFLSIGEDREKYYILNYNDSIKKIIQIIKNTYTGTFNIDLQKLIESCPFKNIINSTNE